VLWASCVFYYASVPLSFLAVLALGLGVFWAFSFLGEIPVQIVLALAVVILVTAWAVLKSLWVSVVRPREIPDPGARLAPGTHPALDRVVRSVAERMGTRPVDAVFLTPGAELAVFERGVVWRQLAGRAERCLILGAGVFDGMTQGELKAVLAHEYGHLVNRDTAGGGFALTVRRSILAMAETLAEGGAATWYNPAWWFVRGFYLVFLRISQGASRLQEVLADRWAALAYGGEAFARGLEHAVAQSVRFDRHVARTLREVLEGERSLANVYRYVPAEQEDPAALSAAIAQALDAEPSAYDSHPRARDRIAWTAGILPAGSLELDDDRPVWSLFADRDALERDMTDQLRLVVAERNGVTIPSEDAREGAREDAVA
jgi:Zn-dependent protease with chaperone function